ncbi:EamA family transporter [Acidisoma cellulosilytica]|uniref:EamA family transporter n=1 Tax=Acidisoma cellulosilyticum TaxID=2802395 RepID=A0A963Z5F5_9PROT|nr:SMR family transporter [Acidisoma cellulosilyticum]MCB8882207.1 EamA family transporter [Acidisoma cellulosilyticum]
MTLGTLGLILLSVSLSALAQAAFKFGVGSAGPSGLAKAGLLTSLSQTLLTPGVILGLTLYGIGTLIWLGVLRRVDLSQAYPFIGLGIALTAFLGFVLFGESLSPQKILGTLLVIGGIIIVAWA